MGVQCLWAGAALTPASSMPQTSVSTCFTVDGAERRREECPGLYKPRCPPSGTPGRLGLHCARREHSVRAWPRVRQSWRKSLRAGTKGRSLWGLRGMAQSVEGPHPPPRPLCTAAGLSPHSPAVFCSHPHSSAPTLPFHVGRLHGRVPGASTLPRTSSPPMGDCYTYRY